MNKIRKFLGWSTLTVGLLVAAYYCYLILSEWVDDELRGKTT